MNIRILSVIIFSFLLIPLNVGAQVQPIERIISLGPVITEELFLLHSGPKIIGCTIYCQRPQAAKYIQKVGNVQEINIEKIVALRPDVVLATQLTDPRAIERLRSLGIRVVDIPNARNFEEICNVFLNLGQMVGQENLAQSIIADSKAKVAALKNQLTKVGRVKVFVQVGRPFSHDW